MDIPLLTLAVTVVVMLVATYGVALMWRHIRRMDEDAERRHIIDYRRDHGGGVTMEIASGREPLPKEWVIEWRTHRRRWVP
ncbi:MAG TPA: hypothetical protein VGR87_05895 [Candidatus Limnocylindria bacterium]|jgi:hypothetical protein|nr:hypothetical protein [Candidatus Limnocylindria bacterium]